MMQKHADYSVRANDNTTSLVRTAPPRILVVDDEPDACELLRQVLESEGYETTLATSASNALEKIAKQDFDLVLSDIVMAGMNGLDLCRHIVAVRPGTPVILITGQGNVHMVIAALRIGTSGFLTKPIDAESVVASVAQALQHDALGDISPRAPAEITGPPSEPTSRDQYDGPANDGPDPGVASLFEVERRRAIKTIKLLGGNKSRSAEVLGIDRHAFYRLLRQYQSDRSN